MPRTSCPPQILTGRAALPNGALVVNVFGGPGSGKTVFAGELFCRLKRHDIETACPEEHAKLAIWSGQPWLLDEQSILLGRTWETIHALQDKVQVIVVDSPLLLCSVYANPREPIGFHQMTSDIHRRMSRMNIFLERDPTASYSINGRRETKAQALAVDKRIIKCLDEHNEAFTSISRDDGEIDTIVDAILEYCSGRVLAA